jgi:hypothetical protein
MVPNFSFIDDMHVGYVSREAYLSGSDHLKHITFREFIAPYVHENETPGIVFGNLERALERETRALDSVTGDDKIIPQEVLIVAALKMLAIRSAKDLIRAHYDV